MLPRRFFLLALITALSLITVSIEAQSSGTARRRTVRTPETGLEIYPLAGYQPTIATTADLEPFRTLVGDASVVGLGESFHTSGGFYLMKHRLFRFLVKEMGFRAFAMESNLCTSCHRLVIPSVARDLRGWVARGNGAFVNHPTVQVPRYASG